MTTPQEKSFLDAVYAYVHLARSPEANSEFELDKSLLDSLYALIDLKINPPRETPVLKTLEEHNAGRRLSYEAASRVASHQRTNGIACPKCGTELIDSNPTMTLASYPPQKNIKCPSCDYVGYRVA